MKDRLAEELERQELVKSADLYAELYWGDEELDQLTNAEVVN